MCSCEGHKDPRSYVSSIIAKIGGSFSRNYIMLSDTKTYESIKAMLITCIEAPDPPGNRRQA